MDATGLFAPFKNHDLCLWFYFLSVAGFVLLIISVISIIYSLVRQQKKDSLVWISLSASIWYLIFYFQNRLLYSMCVKSI